MPGDRWQQLANLRALLAWMWAHPGKNLLFMGGELAEDREWAHDRSLDWHLLQQAGHRGIQSLVRDLNRLSGDHAALWAQDVVPDGFRWIDANDAEDSVLSFLRYGTSEDGGQDVVACIANLTPVPRRDYRLGLPRAGRWVELLNTDAGEYGGSGSGTGGSVAAAGEARHGLVASASLTLPPLGVLWMTPE
jgi:1,4-alpha-glucan branching enzyme